MVREPGAGRERPAPAAVAETAAGTGAAGDDTVVELDGVWKIFADDPQAALRAIREQGLSKAEALGRLGAVVGVADVGLRIRRGEIFCVMGLSGSGKSTLVRHVNRLLEPTAGRIVVEGVDVMALSHRALQEFRNRKLGMVFQNFALLPHRSVIDNVAMPLEIRGIDKNTRLTRAARVLGLVHLESWANRFADELSGGMQQRVGLARALAADPDVLLMDEPFSALDPLIRRQLQDEFLKLSQVLKKTTIFITHDLDEAVRIGHRIAIMRDGRVVQTGTAEEIVMHPADDYVAKFVAGISRLRVVHAHAVMVPLEAWRAQGGGIPDGLRSVAPETPLVELIRLSIEEEAPLLVRDGDRALGVVGRREILRAVVEGAELS